MMPKLIAVIPVSQAQGDLGVTFAKATNIKVLKLVVSKDKVSTILAPSIIIPFPVAPPAPRLKGIVIQDSYGPLVQD